MTEIRMQTDVDSSAADVWAVAGKFDSISEWHPAIKRCDLSADGKIRTLHMPDGSTSQERLLSKSDGDKTYRYEAVNPGGPVSALTGTFSVTAKGADKAQVVWSADVDLAPGIPEAQAKQMLGGIFNAAVLGLRQRFSR